MSLMGTLRIGRHYEIRVDAAPTTPGNSALVFGWVPNSGLPPTTPVVDTIPQGMVRLHAGVIPHARMLILDVDVPETAGASVTVTVKEDGVDIAHGLMTQDSRWSFSVVP